MSLLKPFSKLPGLNTANILLVENEEQFQQKLADTVVLQEKTVNVNVLARSLPLPMENEESRPRIDLVVFIIHLTSELRYIHIQTIRTIHREMDLLCGFYWPPLPVVMLLLFSLLSFQSAETSLKYLDPGYFQGKVCFLVTSARNVSVPPERLVSVRKLAASLHCPLLCAEDQTTEGVTTAAHRLLAILKVAAGLVPMATGLYLSTLTRCTVPSDIDQQNFE
uniref:Centromere protein M n=1 Tax=Oncorhynchus mykiss TaxID=8022 RepID=A0A8K9X0T6_ONCMY